MKNHRYHYAKLPVYVLLVGTFAWFIFNYFYGERVFNYDGLGWDGTLYANLATNFDAFSNKLSVYYSQRILPSLIIHFVAKFIGYPLNTTPNVIHAFYIFNIVLVTIGAFYFYLIGKIRHWPFQIKLIGFSALFLNFAVLKFLPYYPVLTDYTALVISIVMLYFYIQNNTPGIIFTLILGAFSFPTLIYVGAFFLLFPYKLKNICTITFSINKLRHRTFLATIFALIITVFSFYYFKTNLPPLEGSYPQIYSHLRPAWVLTISFICLFIYTFLMIRPFIKSDLVFTTTTLRVAITLLLFLSIKLAQLYLSNGAEGPVTILIYFRYILVEAITNPLVFIISHIFYFGPGILLAILFWNSIVTTAFMDSKALVLFLLLYGTLSIGSESREFINALPIFIFLLCETLKNFTISTRFAYCFTVISLIISKFWVSINVPHFSYNPSAAPEEFLTFPYQRFFMNMGPWINNQVYLVELIITLILFLAFRHWKNKLYTQPGKQQ